MSCKVLHPNNCSGVLCTLMYTVYIINKTRMTVSNSFVNNSNYFVPLSVTETAGKLHSITYYSQSVEITFTSAVTLFSSISLIPLKLKWINRLK